MKRYLRLYTEIFQFTPLREGLRKERTYDHDLYRFQFTPLREGLPLIAFFSLQSVQFQFTPLREGLRVCKVIPSNNFVYFNSRPCERGFSSHRGHLK